MKELIIALAVLFIVGLIAFVFACCKVASNTDEAVNENRQLWREINDCNKPPKPPEIYLINWDGDESNEM